MKSDVFMNCLRKSDNSSEILNLFSSLGVKKVPKISKGDTDARVDLEKKGLTLIFLPKGPKTSELVMVAVQFFSEDTEDYSTYSEELPYDLKFTDNQPEVKKKLGKPNRAKKFLAREFWDLDGIVLTVKYTKKYDRIVMVSIHAPEYYQ